MNPEGPNEQSRAIAALAKSRIEALGPRRFGAEWGIRSSIWWTIYHLATDGYSREQIITLLDDRAAEHREWLKEPDMVDVDRVQAQLDLWAEVKAAISAITG